MYMIRKLLISLAFLSNSMERSTIFIKHKLVSAGHKPYEGFNNNIFLKDKSSLMSEYAIKASL